MQKRALYNGNEVPPRGAPLIKLPKCPKRGLGLPTYSWSLPYCRANLEGTDNSKKTISLQRYNKWDCLMLTNYLKVLCLSDIGIPFVSELLALLGARNAWGTPDDKIAVITTNCLPDPCSIIEAPPRILEPAEKCKLGVF